jgi:hypothetical protein
MLGRLVCLFCTAAVARAAYAQPITHPIWAATPNAESDAAARAQFGAALAKRGLPAPEVVQLPAPPPAPAAQLYAQAMAALHASAFEKSAGLFAQAAKVVIDTGAAGLAPGQVASLFFHQAVAVQLAAGSTYSEPFATITPPEAQTAYVQAAILGGAADLDQAADQPLVEASWRIAKALAAARPRTTLTVKAHARATVSVDGFAAQPSPASFANLPIGKHFVRVEEPGHLPWSTTLDLGGAANHIDVPATELVQLDAGLAAAQARAKGAAFALVGELHLTSSIEVDLRLVDAQTGELRASTAVAVAPTPESPDLAASVLRLDEMAAAADLARRTRRANGQARIPLSIAPPPGPAPTGGPDIRQDTRGWLRTHWPLVTAVGAAVASSLVLGIVVAKDTR